MANINNVSVLVFLCMVTLAYSHENENPLTNTKGEEVHNHKSEHHKLKEDPQLHHLDASNREHIQEHLEGVAKSEENMTEEELQFHYFKLHDYNNDNLLDGREMITALMHEHRDEEKKEDDKITMTENGKPIDLGPIVASVDEVMKEYDHNGDGYISYVEFKQTTDRRPS